MVKNCWCQKRKQKCFFAAAAAAKVILYKSCSDIFLLMQCRTCTIGLAQVCNFNRLKLYLTKFLPLFKPNLNAIQNNYRKYRNFMNYTQLAQTSPNLRFCNIKRAHRSTLLDRLQLLLDSFKGDY